jgi:Eukaryotic mitochondrial regulator protein
MLSTTCKWLLTRNTIRISSATTAIHCRLFNANSKGEPPYQVEFDMNSPDPRSVQVPYLRDHTRVEMYRKHVEDPVAWSVEKLSQHYGSSIDRTNAVLYLMGKREETQRKLGVIDMPEEHKKLYEKHTSDPAAFTAQVLSDESGLAVQQVQTILSNLQQHHARLTTLNDSEEHMATVMASLEGEGIDTSFREVSLDNTLAQKYTPRLFGDDEEEEAIALLKKLIEKETRAKVEPSVDEFINNARKQGIAAPEESNNAGVKTDSLSRWKFAFRDTSRVNVQPTMIRTRRGGWRVATPLEDSHRSWTKSTSYFNNEMNKSKWEPYLDPDGDEREAGKLAIKKRDAVETRKKAKEVAKA